MSKQVFTVAKARKPKKNQSFAFQIEGDSTVWQLPLLQYLDPTLARRLRRSGLKAFDLKSEKPKLRTNVTPEDLAVLDQLVEDIFERYCPGLYGQLTDDQVNLITEAWQDASAVTMGKSSAS
jgi:hypothetical protein